ncbi:hypothetical protein RRG08_053517 [Elysia crispata]|uniref:Uncharacterized protein n=1 Tax=Elysia crispata TaxID=231223 RepID=A0AAE1CR81_9GAST|nr:hypothetical protein RRG08_053517 [Elysia crispata]
MDPCTRLETVFIMDPCPQLETFKMSSLWTHVHVLKLRENMFDRKTGESPDFSKLPLAIDNGCPTTTASGQFKQLPQERQFKQLSQDRQFKQLPHDRHFEQIPQDRQFKQLPQDRQFKQLPQD